MTVDSRVLLERSTPGVGKRLICLFYEGVVLFGVVMVAGFLYAGMAEQRHALVGTSGLQMFLLVVLGLYFVWFWSHGGQTVAMKTWRIRVQRIDGSRLSAARAIARYLLGWLWLLPALSIVRVAGLNSVGSIVATVLAGILAYAGLCWLHPARQFLHDALCGTCLVDWPQPRCAEA